jgi:translation elongation factor EF-G
MVLQDGAFHITDSSELAFRNCAIGAFRGCYNNAKPVILEPIMTVEVVAPIEFQSGYTLLLFHRLSHQINVGIRRYRDWWTELSKGHNH